MLVTWHASREYIQWHFTLKKETLFSKKEVEAQVKHFTLKRMEITKRIGLEACWGEPIMDTFDV